MVKPISFIIAFFGIMFLLTASTFALPPLPPGGLRPDQPGEPNPPDSPGTQLPPQPSLPPCPECDRFITPTPTGVLISPTPTLGIGGVNPTPTPGSENKKEDKKDGEGDGRSDGRSDGRGGVGGTSGQVLGLASTSGESEQIFKQIGTVWMLTGLGLIGLSQRKKFFGN